MLHPRRRHADNRLLAEGQGLARSVGLREARLRREGQSLVRSREGRHRLPRVLAESVVGRQPARLRREGQLVPHLRHRRSAALFRLRRNAREAVVDDSEHVAWASCRTLRASCGHEGADHGSDAAAGARDARLRDRFFADRPQWQPRRDISLHGRGNTLRDCPEGQPLRTPLDVPGRQSRSRPHERLARRRTLLADAEQVRGR